METLVNKLAMWQAERKKVEDLVSNDSNVINGAKYIEELKAQIAETRKSMVFLRAEYDDRMSEIDDEIKHVSAQIINAWDGDKKTMPFDVGTLKFRSSQNLEMRFERRNKPKLLQYLLDTVPFEDVAEVYIIGYSLTALERLSDIECKTTVKLEQKE